MADNDLLRWKQVQTLWNKIKTWCSNKFVTLDTAQTITGKKVFGSAQTWIGNTALDQSNGDTDSRFRLYTYDNDKHDNSGSKLQFELIYPKAGKSAMYIFDFKKNVSGTWTQFGYVNDDSSKKESIKSGGKCLVNGGAVYSYITDQGYLKSISDNSITTAKLADKAVTTAKMADASITTGKLGSSAVTWEKMATNSIGTGELKDNSVTGGKIADKSITPAKLELGCMRSYPIWGDLRLVANKVYSYVNEGVLSWPTDGDAGDSIVVTNGTEIAPKLKLADNTVLTFPAGSSLVFNKTTEWYYKAILPSTAPTTPMVIPPTADGYVWLTQSTFNYFEGITADCLKLILPTGFEGQYVDVLLNNATAINVSIGLNTAPLAQTVITASKTTGLALRLIYVGGTWKICYNNTNTVDASKPASPSIESDYITINHTSGTQYNLKSNKIYRFNCNLETSPIITFNLPDNPEDGDRITIDTSMYGSLTMKTNKTGATAWRGIKYHWIEFGYRKDRNKWYLCITSKNYVQEI